MIFSAENLKMEDSQTTEKIPVIGLKGAGLWSFCAIFFILVCFCSECIKIYLGLENL
ncbi:unnamed protein product [Larinioides sclopetarius]|uniref:Uncharacterized protein n=1 Tax=Larinioides sclopetarius TaxID=280406 RepID=A0AAV1ZUN1_9ARAC